MSSALKFLHASDFHLDRPMTGLAGIPAHLKQSLANAPYAAAERLFDLALGERVDFVLLAGDIVDLGRGGPRSAAFLLGQFERLADKGIQVYWCAGSVDHPDRWPGAVELPDNVTIFPSSIVEQADHTRNGQIVATICGAGADNQRRKPADFRCSEDRVFPIALLHGELDTTGIAAQNIRYWALGGKHERQVIDKNGTLAVYPGTIQSRCPAERGACGVTLVTVNAEGKLTCQAIELDSVRWSLQKISVAENATRQDLKDALCDRCLKIRAEDPDQLLLVKWRISTTGEFNAGLRDPVRVEELVTWLRSEFGQSAPSLWTTSLNIDLPRALPAAWYEEETILGEYLRAVGRFQGDASLALSLTDYLPDTSMQDPLLEDPGRVPGETRGAVLKRAALIGVEYLAAPREDDLETDAPSIQHLQS
jgi:DNA repair exonuclease SbcCD nuclease subunit